MTITDFIPPIAFKIRRKLLNGAPKDVVAPEVEVREETAGYEDKEVCDVVADKTVTFRDSPAQVMNQVSGYMLAGLNHVIHGRESVTVLDFGGACGIHYYEMRRCVSVKLKWIVVETPCMVQSAKERYLGNDELTFRDSLDNLPPIDFVYSSGTLQMVDDPYIFLNQLLNIGAEYLMLNRMALNENNRDAFTTHKAMLSDNGVGKMPAKYTDRVIWYPYKAMALDRFNSVVSAKYRKLWEFREDSGALDIYGEKIIGRAALWRKR